MEVGALQATGSAWDAIQGDILRIVTHPDTESAFDCGIRRQPYFPKVRWICYFLPITGREKNV